MAFERPNPARRVAFLLAWGFALAALPAAAQTLYKLIDKNGKITYSEEAPKNFDGQVIRIDIDPNRNTATLPKYEPPKAPSTERVREGDGRKPRGDGKKASPEQQLLDARERLEAARKALADARDNPKEGEVALVGKVGGGARQVPSEAYQAKLTQLEKAVKDAEDNLQTLERGR